ncbi:uncharacterized protein BCR38DRAFT_171082 [Pseudomassariella vexata]|uniref:Uncharacterized protein n=1 Tax=Pseudomassariella vexata TaxID=1141098 RepID=A0A1Y2E3C5_9PEZI|nr:uncharacterized protein BCR38DRAFT_171082 [Pseudomassariella vexata]ORY66009.1 hypothetical protein BCR38DRAFT_171082 [Pseudomassariella vexata]
MHPSTVPPSGQRCPLRTTKGTLTPVRHFVNASAPWHANRAIYRVHSEVNPRNCLQTRQASVAPRAHWPPGPIMCECDATETAILHHRRHQFRRRRHLNSFALIQQGTTQLLQQKAGRCYRRTMLEVSKKLRPTRGELCVRFVETCVETCVQTTPGIPSCQ